MFSRFQFARRRTGDIGGTVTTWLGDTEVAANESGSKLLVTLGIPGERTTELEMLSEVHGDTLRVRYTIAGVTAERIADRASSTAVQAYLASRPTALPFPELVELLPNGLAAVPPMGWNSWYAFRKELDDRSIREIADALVETGLRDAGYTYVNLDDGWEGVRDSHGVLVPNSRFPDMKGLGDYLHDRGLKFGIYSSPGPATCADYVGSFGYEERDAETFAGWGVDYLKYDWCSAFTLYRSPEDMKASFQKMGRALRATGRDVVFSLCQYGMFDVPKWGAGVGGNLWRIGRDVEDTWESIETNGFGTVSTPMGGWNDPDMLQVGLGGLGLEEYRTQMSAWAMRSAPLIMSCDVRKLSFESREILGNPEVIAVDQDPLGAPETRYSIRGLDVWSKPVTHGTAVGLFNRGDQTAAVDIAWSELGWQGSATVRDLWARAPLYAAERWIGEIPAHGTVLLLLKH
jgi:alpha-galactosidase